MVRTLSSTLAQRVVDQSTALKTLERDLRLFGATSVADAVARAHQEFEHQTVTGELNKAGANSKSVRP